MTSGSVDQSQAVTMKIFREETRIVFTEGY